MAQTATATLSKRDSASSLRHTTFVFPSPSNSSSGSVTRPRRHTDLSGSHHVVSRPKSASNLLGLGCRYQLREYDETFMTDNLQDRHRRDDVAALVDFLHNQAPPPDNFMSVPDVGGGDDDARGRWSAKLKWVSKRSRSVPRAPHPIRLPDSAVSGTTIGGHRHIAISIPIEAAPLGDTPRSQYPVFAPESRPDSRANSTESVPIRTFTNDKGVVTVLRTVNEDRESSSLPRYTIVNYARPYSPASRPGISSRRSASPGALSINTTYGKQEHWIARPNDWEYASLAGPRHSRHSSAEQRRGATLGTQHWRMCQRAAHPPRGSSVVPQRVMLQEPSIDGVILSQESRKIGFTCSPAGSKGRSLSLSVVDSQREEAIIAEAPSAISVKSTCIVVDEMPPQEDEEEEEDGWPMPMPMPVPSEKLKHMGVPFPDSPLLPPNFDSPPTPGSITRSRKEIVRYRKKRDMEAMRIARLQRLEAAQAENTKTRAHDAARDQATELDWTAATAPGERAESRPGVAENGNGSAQECQGESQGREQAPDGGGGKAESERKSGPSLVPIMVVADLEPLPDRLQAAPASRTQDKGKLADPASMAFELSGSKRIDTLTPPTSSSGSPPQRHDSVEGPRPCKGHVRGRAGEQEKTSRGASAAARFRMARASGGTVPVSEDVGPSGADEEILRLYEAYRDQRIREMERRVRRLERNGDVWLRALVPVLNNVNRTMASVQGSDEAVRGWASEDEAPHRAGRRRSSAATAGPGGWKRPSRRRASLSQARRLERLGRPAAGGEAWEGRGGGSTGDGADDATGLGMIEPLMRELAGEASRRVRVGERLGVGEDGRRPGTL